MPANPVPLPSPDADSYRRVAKLMDGYLVTQLLYVAVKLGIIDALAGGPATAAELAATTGAEPRALNRVLRGLAAEAILDEQTGQRFALTDLGACLQSDDPVGLGGAVLPRGDLYFRAAAGLAESMQSGIMPFEQAYGDTMFSHLAAHPHLREQFQQSMQARSRREAVDIVAAYDFGPYRHLVDVGGGTGTLLRHVLERHPHLRGTLFDRTEVIDAARASLNASGVADRCALAAGDFFEAVPEGGDVMMLSRVVHDWNDTDAHRILVNCRNALRPGGTLLLAESLVPERAIENPEAIRMDLHMLLVTSGHERTAAEYEALLTGAGFAPPRSIGTPSPSGLAIVQTTVPGRGSGHTP